MPTENTRPHFDLIVVVDFSAAASVGPRRPAKDRCWMAAGSNDGQAEPVYFRTRLALLEALKHHVSRVEGHVLIAWDFPFGYPMGSGIGGGSMAASRMFDMIEDREDGGNNRFVVAEALNQQIGMKSGPFWGRPSSLKNSRITETRMSFEDAAFHEWRVVERMARAAGYHHLQSVWKLYTTGSVGSQALMGLALIARLNRCLGDDRPKRFWPFDTGWDRALDGVVHAECWPSLFSFDHIDHSIRDAQQVAATCEILTAANVDGRIFDFLACPMQLSSDERKAAEREEGWILGFKPDR